MRIIAGQLKGRRILEPLDKKTRPLKDLAKESVFNLIKHSNILKIKLENSIILDLFAGVGSFGLEALSREAKEVTFVDNYSVSLKILRKNIDNFHLNERCTIIEKNIFENLEFNFLEKKFDLIFLDPPFKEKNISNLIFKIYKSNILKKNSIIIIHRNSKNEDVLPSEFKVLEVKKYGVSKILFGKF